MSKSTQKPINEFTDSDDLLQSINKFVKENEKELEKGSKYLILNPICLEFLNMYLDGKRVSFALKKNEILDLKYIISLIQYLKFNPNLPELLEKVKPLDLVSFEKLNRLEMTFIKPALITNLFQLSRNLVSISVHNALYSLDELLIVEDEIKLPHYAETSRETFMDIIDPIEIQQKRFQSLYKKNGIWAKLKKLDCSFNHIPKIDQSTYSLINIEELNLEGNLITKIENLHECLNLTSLNLSYNRITKFDNINELLGMITKLYLRNNGIECIEGIQKLYALETLDISDNNIRDIEEIFKLKNLPHLTNLSLEENPFCELKYYKYLILSTFFEGDTSILNIKPFYLNHQLITALDLKKDGSMKNVSAVQSSSSVGKIKPIKDDTTVSTVTIAPNAKIDTKSTPSQPNLLGPNNNNTPIHPQSGPTNSTIVNNSRVVDLEHTPTTQNIQEELEAGNKGDAKFEEEQSLRSKLDHLRSEGGSSWLLILNEDDGIQKVKEQNATNVPPQPTPEKRIIKKTIKKKIKKTLKPIDDNSSTTSVSSSATATPPGTTPPSNSTPPLTSSNNYNSPNYNKRYSTSNNSTAL